LLDTCAGDYAAWRALSALQPDGVLDGTQVLLVAQEKGPSNAVEIGSFAVLTKPLYVERATDAITAYLNGVQNGDVLIADEDPHVRQILTEALSAVGCKVAVAADGVEAMRCAVTRKPHIVVMSLTLRGSNGVTTLASLRANPTLRDIPILMLVPRELTSEQMEQLQNAVNTLTKSGEVPLKPLVEMIRAALQAQAVVA
jgi:CheY-like chemotaxis protein